MQIIPPGDYVIKNVKCHNDSDILRITFDWPPALEQVNVCILRGETETVKLLTLQEYRKHSGFLAEKTQGEAIFRIYPLVWSVTHGGICNTEDAQGEYVLYDQTESNSVTFIEKTIISCSMKETIGEYKNHEITISVNYPVHENIICYVKKKNGLPQDITDGVLYHFDETVTPGQPINRVVRTMKNEYIRFFVMDEVAYGIV